MALLVVAACGCSSSRVGGRYLYHDKSDPPRLLDGEIRVETFRRVRGKRTPDVRVLRCKDGKVTGLVESIRGAERGEVELPVEVWARAWSQLWPGAFEYEAEEADPSGSYYHLVNLRLGRKARQFSAQRVSSVFGAVIKQRQERTDVVNQIVELLDKEVETSPWEPPEEE